MSYSSSTGDKSIQSYLQEWGYEFNEKENEIILKECPYCHPHNDKPDNLWKFSINSEKGVYYCHRCEAKGHWRDFRKNIEVRVQCQRIWTESIPLINDPALPVIAYLRNRGLNPNLRLDSLRFHAGLTCESQRFPSLVAKVSDNNGNLIGVQRVFLTESGQKAPVTQPKMSLGPIMGGAVHLDDASETLAIAEGIETALAVRQGTKLPTWSAVSAPGMAKLILPSSTKVVRIFADLDPNKKGEKAAEILAARLHKQGIKVFVHLPKPIGTGGNSGKI